MDLFYIYGTFNFQQTCKYISFMSDVYRDKLNKLLHIFSKLKGAFLEHIKLYYIIIFQYFSDQIFYVKIDMTIYIKN